MSDAGGEKIKLWDGIIEYDEPVPGAKTEAVKATIDAGLTAFGRHQEALLEILRNEHGSMPSGRVLPSSRDSSRPSSSFRVRSSSETFFSAS
jgi:hypothetical protein